MNYSQQLPRLPVELIDNTVDFLHNDLESLWTCTSVSRTFLRSARCHLFRNLCVGDEPTEQGEQGYATFLRFLQRTPEVCAYIRQLKLVRYHSSDKQLPSPEICSHTLGAIIAYLPRLHTLTIGKSVHFACHCPVTHIPPHQDPVKLQYLSLESVRIATSVDLSEFLQLFSEIHKLAVLDLCILEGSRRTRNSEWETDREEALMVKSKLGVRELVLDTAHAHEFGSFEMLSTVLGRRIDFQSLHSVTFGFDHQRQIEPFGALMSHSAEDLQHLTLRLPAHPYSQIPS